MATMLWVINVALVAAWVMMNGISSLSTDALTSTTTVGKNINFLDPYPVLRFYTLSGNQRKSYLELIRGIRDMLTDGGLDPVFGIPRLPDRDHVQSNRRFLQVELINSNEDNITVVLHTSRLYVVGYRRPNEFHYFPDTAEGVETLFPDLPHTVLPFDSSYGALAREAGGRSTIPLGMTPLEQAIISLQANARPDLARAFTVIVQMFTEAIRFRYIEDFIGNIIRRRDHEEVPSATMLDLENEWGALSKRIQRSVDGTLNPPVQLANRVNVRNNISTVSTGLALNIGILFFVCNRPPNPNQLSLISTTPLHIDGRGTNHTNISEPIIRLPIEKGAGHTEAAEDICKDIGEPTVRIVGRNCLCADVKDGRYHNGNPIILWPCKSNEDVNQLWTLKTDGTIRSNEKCLTTYEDPVPGNYIMIFDCFGATLDSTKWHIWDNGTITNPKSSLVMSATTGNTGNELMLQENMYSTSQGWVVANNTQTTVTPIMNNEDMCLEALDYDPKISYSGCQSGETRQSFAVYPDGSIRPDKRRDDCLTADNPNSIVVIAGCNGGAEQRWSFNRDYTITNMDTGLAMDAEDNVVRLSPYVPGASQEEWHAWFL